MPAVAPANGNVTDVGCENAVRFGSSFGEVKAPTRYGDIPLTAENGKQESASHVTV